MKITGIICEYNPFHLGHLKQFHKIKEQNPDSGIVCLMSGNYVQRGHPAIFDKSVRAKAALLSGADLVLELPVTAALSSAEGFASEGVRILSSICDDLSFGAETGSVESLMQIAEALVSEKFSVLLKKELETGLSFPAARQQAIEKMGYNGQLLSLPNNILAVEYCKAILTQNTNLKPMPIQRLGDYHSTIPDNENPSATFIRTIIERGEKWSNYAPNTTHECYKNASVHSLNQAESAILYRLRTMSDSEYENLPYGTEGLWHKLMKNARRYATLEEIITQTKSKRYTRTRLDRMILCAFLGLAVENLARPAPYVRVLALNDKGRKILLKARQFGDFPNIGEIQDDPFQNIENRCDDLYGFFSSIPENPGITSKRRIFYSN